MSEWLAQNRAHFSEGILVQVKEAYLNKKDNPKIFLSVNRHALEMMVNDILDLHLASLPADHKDKALKKQPLEGVISALQKKDILPAYISAYMHIVRICGNYGTHDQEGDFEQTFPMIQDESMQRIVCWYAKSCLGISLDFGTLISDVSRTRFIVHDSAVRRDKRRRSRVLRVLDFLWQPVSGFFSFLLSNILSVVVSLLVMAAVYVFLYAIGVVNLPPQAGDYIDRLLGL